MRRPLVVAVAQPRCVAGSVAANAQLHAEVIDAATRLDSGVAVVVFPELSLTGYELDAVAVDPIDGLLAPLVRTCRARGVVALAGAPVAGDGEAEHLATFAVDGDGARVAYRKMWLGDAETDRFTPGAEPAAIEVCGWRLGLGICRDTGIAEQTAATAALGIDAYVAGVLEHAADGDVAGARATRIAADHDVWVAIASFAGSTGGGYDRAAGGSGVWAPGGGQVSSAGAETGEVATAALVP